MNILLSLFGGCPYKDFFLTTNGTLIFVKNNYKRNFNKLPMKEVRWVLNPPIREEFKGYLTHQKKETKTRNSCLVIESIGYLYHSEKIQSIELTTFFNYDPFAKKMTTFLAYQIFCVKKGEDTSSLSCSIRTQKRLENN